MKIHVLSDLHLDFLDFVPPLTDADVVVLAGDIDEKARGVAWAQCHFKTPVIYVPGNHEYYHGSLGHTLKKMRAAAYGTNVHLLTDSSVVVDGVRFLGGTLWTDYNLMANQPLAMVHAQLAMHDFKYIRDETFRKVRPYQLAARHAATRNFLQKELDCPFEGPTVVVTHHAPSAQSLTGHYRDAPTLLNAAYASRLDHLLGSAALWAHGHTHETANYVAGATRVVSNPRGYAPKHLNPNFDPGLVVSV